MYLTLLSARKAEKRSRLVVVCVRVCVRERERECVFVSEREGGGGRVWGTHYS